jgi:phospholipase C
MKPPTIDTAGYGLRVPGLVISAYARHGLIDHQTLSHDAYARFIEDVFLGGARLDPKTDGRPDSRPDVRENDPTLGNLLADFDFNQAPRAPLILDPNPAPGPASTV